MMKRATVWKILRKLCFGSVGLVVLVALILAEENFRGKRAWENYKREAEARGVAFDPRPFIPPPVPDEKNFATTPLLKPLFGGEEGYETALSERLKMTPKKSIAKKPMLPSMGNAQRADLVKWREYLGNPDILDALKKFGPELDEISAACRRPFARFPLRYEDGVSASVSHLGPLMNLSKLYELRALAALEAGQTDLALADIESTFQLAESFGDEPLLISQLVRASLLSVGVQVVWEGLEARRWSESQLVTLQERLERIDLLTGALRSVRYELAVLPESTRKLLNDPKAFSLGMSISMSPLSWEKHSEPSLESESWRILFKNTLNQNMLFAYRFDEEYLPSINPEKRRVDAAKIKEAEQKLQDMHGTFRPYTFVACLRASTVYRSFSKFTYAQTTVDEALIACALERYRLAHGEFPDTLNALVPQYLAKLKHDIINGEPLRYRRTDDGLFLLYSVGWNETDDHGAVGVNKDKRQDIQQGDWVWRHASSPEK